MHRLSFEIRGFLRLGCFVFYLTLFSIGIGVAGTSGAAPARASGDPAPHLPLAKSVLFLGDSLTEGYGVKKEQAYPEIAARVLAERGHPIKVINGSISGSVSADADRRLSWFLKAKPDIVLIALGSNDGLKGTSPEVIKKNLAKAIDLAQANHVKVLLTGQKVFTNFGSEYTKAFENVFKELAREKKVAFMPFLLESVALKDEFNQADGKHPNAAGHERVGKDVARELEKLL